MKGSGHGIDDSTAVDESFLSVAGGLLVFGVRRGFLPPSCVLVGTVLTPGVKGASSSARVDVVAVESSKDGEAVSLTVAKSPAVFLFLFRTI